MELNEVDYAGALSTGLMDFCLDEDSMGGSFEYLLFDELNIDIIKHELDNRKF